MALTRESPTSTSTTTIAKSVIEVSRYDVRYDEVQEARTYHWWTIFGPDGGEEVGIDQDGDGDLFAPDIERNLYDQDGRLVETTRENPSSSSTTRYDYDRCD